MALANLWLFGPVVRRQFLGAPATAAMLRTTTAVTMLRAGVKENVLPADAAAVVNFRIIPGESTESVTELCGSGARTLWPTCRKTRRRCDCRRDR